MTELERITIDDFSGKVGETFLIQSGDGPGVPAELVEVSPLGDPPPGGGRIPFSLLFRTGRPSDLPQGIFRLASDTMSELDLFLVPVGPDRATGGSFYEAVFN